MGKGYSVLLEFLNGLVNLIGVSVHDKVVPLSGSWCGLNPAKPFAFFQHQVVVGGDLTEIDVYQGNS